MRDRKGCRLLRERQWKFPDQNDGRVHKDGKRAVLEFAGEIAADPGVRTQEGPVAFGPTARYIGEHRQDRYFIIIVPKNERIVPEENETECDNAQAGSERTEKIWPPINTDFHRCSNGEKPSPSSSPHSGERAGGRIVSPDLCSSVVIRGKIFEFKKRPAYPRSSRGLCPRCHERGRTPAIVAAARGVAQSRGEMFRNASESMFGRQVPGTP